MSGAEKWHTFTVRIIDSAGTRDREMMRKVLRGALLNGVITGFKRLEAGEDKIVDWGDKKLVMYAASTFEVMGDDA